MEIPHQFPGYCFGLFSVSESSTSFFQNCAGWQLGFCPLSPFFFIFQIASIFLFLNQLYRQVHSDWHPNFIIFQPVFFSSLAWVDLFILLVQLCIIFYIYKLSHKKDDPPKPFKYELLWSKSIAVSCFLITFSLFTFSINRPIFDFIGWMNYGVEGIEGSLLPIESNAIINSNLEFATSLGLMNFHVANTFSYIHRLNLTMQKEWSAQQLKKAKKVFSEQHQSNSLKSPLFGSAKGRNVYLVQLESLQHFAIDLKEDGKHLMPTMNRLSHELGLSWEYIFDVTMGGGTADAEFSALTGLPPDPGLPTAIFHFNNISRPLPLVLKELGWHTSSFHGFYSSIYNRSVWHRAFGIESLYFEDKYSANKGGWGIDDDTFFKESVSFIANTPMPHFNFLISLTQHHPYSLDKDIKISDPTHGKLKDKVATGYLKTSMYIDKAIQTFLDHLEKKNLLNNSIFIFYGDHIGKMNPNNQEALSTYLNMNISSIPMKKIPLIIYIPGKEKLLAKYRKDISQIPGTIYDIYPTILHLLGIKAEYGILGTHLLNKGQQNKSFFIDEQHVIFNKLLINVKSKTVIDYTKSTSAPIIDQDEISLQISKAFSQWKTILDMYNIQDGQKKIIEERNLIPQSEK